VTAKKGPRKLWAWHFLPEDSRLRWGSHEQVKVGKVYSLPPHEMPELCKRGMHGSVRPLDALQYAPGPIICRVRLWGDVQQGDDKIVARHREVVAMADATRTLHEFALWCAEQALALIPNPDPRSRNALAVKRAWLDGEATDAELDAAGAAAWAAAWAAARAAARDAAGGAAWAAARDVARDAARADQNDHLAAMLRGLLGVPR
jgi:hypothetical protein